MGYKSHKDSDNAVSVAVPSSEDRTFLSTSYITVHSILDVNLVICLKNAYEVISVVPLFYRVVEKNT